MERYKMKTELDQVLSLTKLGKLHLSGRATTLLLNELRLLVLLSKPSSLRETVALFPGCADQTVIALAADLQRRGYICASDAVKEDDGIDFSAPENLFSPHITDMQKAALQFDKAKAELMRRGFYVSIARMAGQQSSPVNGDAYSILIIEDDPYLARTYEQLLAMMNCRATLAGNRADIEAAFQSGAKFDLILLDLNLPDIGGFNILHLLSSHEKLGATPVIVVSSDTTKESILRALTLGADGYVTKPITVDNLTDSIKSVVGLPVTENSGTDPWAGVI